MEENVTGRTMEFVSRDIRRRRRPSRQGRHDMVIEKAKRLVEARKDVVHPVDRHQPRPRGKKVVVPHSGKIPVVVWTTTLQKRSGSSARRETSEGGRIAHDPGPRHDRHGPRVWTR